MTDVRPWPTTFSKIHALKERKDDCYETPPIATRALLRNERIAPKVWEPCCGPGAMVSILRDAGHEVIATDLVDYGCPESAAGVDFLMETTAPEDVDEIVTNPPYKLSDAFVEHGLRLCRRVIILQRLAYLEGVSRSRLIDQHLERVWLGRERLPMMHRHGYDGKKVSSAGMPFAWFVFRREPTGGAIDLRRMSWRDA